MGAATAIHYCSELNTTHVRGLVLDSPFSDAKTMIKDALAEDGIPRLVTSLCLLPIASTVKDKTGFDVLDNSPLMAASKIRVPTLMMVAKNDTVTRPERVEEIFSAVTGKKSFRQPARNFINLKVNTIAGVTIRYSLVVSST